MKNVNYLVAIAVVTFSLSFTSCKKDSNSEGLISSAKVTAFQDDAQATDMTSEVDNESDETANGNTDLKSGDTTKQVTGRQIIWINNNDGTKTATITYTNFQNPYSKSERIKNGVINIVVTGKRTDNTYKRVVTFTNFTVNGNKLEGTRTIEKTGDYTYAITMENGKITFTDNSTITFQSAHVRTQVDGTSTPLYIWDDAYTMEGSANGVSRNGDVYTKAITTPVKVLTTYRFPVSGMFTLTVGSAVFTLDYGDGTLDNLATISKDGVSKVIILRK